MCVCVRERERVRERGGGGGELADITVAGLSEVKLN